MVDACLEEIAPNDTEILFQSLYKESKSDSTVDSKYRESQADWYGKRGIPWHLTVAITKDSNEKMQMLTFAHIF